ncbi:aspartyl protease family protein [Candidatus Roizmanbacteria bacterium]|nr:aspartyl protease family protein [Candidatus Roizmanbacteria bacterium]
MCSTAILKRIGGLTYLPVEFGNPVDKKLMKGKFFIDSGAVYSVVDKSVLHKLGIKPHSKRTFILANGDEIHKEVGDAFLSIVDRKQALRWFSATKISFCSAQQLDRELRPLPMVI